MGVYYVESREPSPWAASLHIVKDGRRVRRISYHRTKRAAEDVLAHNLVAVKDRSFASARDAVRVDRLCDLYLAAKRLDVRTGTADGYTGLVEMYLRPAFGPRPVRDLTRADVEDLKAALIDQPPPAVVAARLARYVAAYGVNEDRWRTRAARPVGRRTVAAVLALLSDMLEFGIEVKATTFNAAKRVKKRGSVRSAKVDAAHVLTVEEARRLIAVTPAHYRTLVRFAVETGLREAELFGLQWGDLDLRGALVNVRRQWRRGTFAELKTTNSQRIVPLTPGLVTDLKRWRLACPKAGLDLVFPNPVGRPISPSNFLSRVYYPAFERAGFERVELGAARFRFHQLRHTYATQALAAGISVSEVSRYLGHSSIAVTLAVYAHVLPGGHDAARDKLAGRYDGIAARDESETEVKQLAAARSGGMRNSGD